MTATYLTIGWKPIGVYQFSPVGDGSWERSASEYDDTDIAAVKDVKFEVEDTSQGALYFESCSGSSWQSQNLTFLYQIGDMRFYKWK